MGTDNGTPVEYIRIGLSWTHLLKRLVCQVQRDLDLGGLPVNVLSKDFDHVSYHARYKLEAEDPSQ